MAEKLGRKALFIGISRKKEENGPLPDPVFGEIRMVVSALESALKPPYTERLPEFARDSPASPLVYLINQLLVTLQDAEAKRGFLDDILDTLPLACVGRTPDGATIVTNKAFRLLDQETDIVSRIPESQDSSLLTVMRRSDGAEQVFQYDTTRITHPDGMTSVLSVFADVTAYLEKIRELSLIDEEKKIAPLPPDTPEREEGVEDLTQETPDKMVFPEENHLAFPAAHNDPPPADLETLPDEATGFAHESPLEEGGLDDEEAQIIAQIIGNAGLTQVTQESWGTADAKNASPIQEDTEISPEPEVLTFGPAISDAPIHGDSPTAPVTEEEGVTEIEVVEFTLGEEAYAVDINLAREIVEMMSITPIPRAPTYLAGVLNLRGEITNIICLTSILGVSNCLEREDQKIIVLSSEAAGGENVGIIVDDVRSVSQIPVTRIERLGAEVVGKTRSYIKGIIKKEEKEQEKRGNGDNEPDLVLWLDLKKVLRELTNQ